MTGSFIFLAFWSPSRHDISKSTLRMIQSGVIGLILTALLPFLEALADEIIAKKQFPVLASFETPFELERWEGNSEFAIERNIAWHGKSSLKIFFNTALYSGVFLIHFPGDWREFNFLKLEVFNPYSETFEIHGRIYDKLHITNDFSANDRFHSTFILHSGWNDITLPLEQVLNAQINRTMDLANICSFGIFVVRLAEPKVLYIDHLRLVK